MRWCKIYGNCWEIDRCVMMVKSKQVSVSRETWMREKGEGRKEVDRSRRKWGYVVYVGRVWEMVGDIILISL